MAKFTTIDWQRDSLLLARGELLGETTLLESLALEVFTKEGESENRNPQAALLRASAKLGVKGPVTVLASRELVEMRTLQIPKMDAEELPDIIRFQAQRQFTNMTDGWVVDFVMLPLAPDQEMQTALVVAMSPTNLAEIDTCCNAAGLQAERILLRPLEVARLAAKRSLAATTDCSMVVCVSETFADILLLRRGHVVLVRNTRLPDEANERITALQSEIRRSLLAGSSELAGGKVETVIVIATDLVGQPLVGPIQAASKASVQLLSLEQLIAWSSEDKAEQSVLLKAGPRLAAIAGAMQSAPGAATGVDFKHPKKRQPQKKNTRTLVLSLAAGTAILLLGLGWYFTRLSQLNSEFEQYSSEIASREDVGKAAEVRIAELQALEKFLNSSPNWLDELAYITQKMPPASKVKLENPSFSISQKGEGVISLTVKADEASSIAEFEKSLRDPNHVVSGTGASQLQSPDENYRWRAQSNIEVVGRGWKVPAPGSATKQSENAESVQSRALPRDDQKSVEGVNDDTT